MIQNCSPPILVRIKNPAKWNPSGLGRVWAIDKERRVAMIGQDGHVRSMSFDDVELLK